MSYDTWDSFYKQLMNTLSKFHKIMSYMKNNDRIQFNILHMPGQLWHHNMGKIMTYLFNHRPIQS